MDNLLDVIKISYQTKFIQSQLQKWADENDGVAEIADDLEEMWRIAFNRSSSPRCIIAYLGEDIIGDDASSEFIGRIERHFGVLVSSGKGYTPKRGDQLVEIVGNSKPFYDLLEEARDVIRVLQFDRRVIMFPIKYKSMKPALPADAPMNAYMIEFSLICQQRMVYQTEDSRINVDV
jgi:hypothetical protein